MNPDSYRSIDWEGPDEHGVLTITLNRPRSANALDEAMHDELGDVARRLRLPGDIGAVLLIGAGPTFCAGGDLQFIEHLASDGSFRARKLDVGIHLVQDWLQIHPPVVTAIQGNAIGFGATIALLGDVVYMAEDAGIADPHVRVGVVAGDGGAIIWPALVGPNRAKELLMTGDALDATTAFQLGLVNHVLPAAEVVTAAVEMARRLASGPRRAIAWTKQSVNASLLRDAVTVMPLSIAQEARTMGEPDVHEGIASIRDRRAPVWPSGTNV